MHKYLKLVICLALLLVAGWTSAMANSWVVMGNVDILNARNIDCSVYYDFSKTRMVDEPYAVYMKSKGSRFQQRWKKEVLPAGVEQFVAAWNNANAAGLRATKFRGAEYSIVIAPTYLDMSYRKAMFGRRGARFDGFISVYHGKDCILKIAVSQHLGRCCRKQRNRLGTLMKGLAIYTLEDVK